MGVLAALVYSVCLYYLLVHVKASPTVGSTLAFGAAALVSFSGHLKLSFKSTVTANQAAPKFLLAGGILYLANVTTLNVLFSIDLLSPQVIVVLSTALNIAISYLLQRSWVFKAS